MTYVLSDIHGRRKCFDSVMEQIQLSPKDDLYVLGDVIDRHAYGIELLQRIMDMPNAHMLLGNHEYMMMASLRKPEDPDLREQWFDNGGNITFQKLMRLTEAERQRIYSYLDSLPLNIEITVGGKDYLLVHGSPVCTASESPLFHGDIAFYAVWERITRWSPLPQGKTVIFGHTPTEYYQSGRSLRIWKWESRIGIDCGCAYRSGGRLGCLRLEDMREFYSKS